jgi:SAM-dependent methyltransferase
MKEMWNQRYAAEEFVYGTEPNLFFKQELDKRVPGRILLPAEGEGRNAVYAAWLGWDVWAFDQSAEGQKKAYKLAAERNTSIRYDLCDIGDCSYPEAFFDVIALIFVHTPASVRQAFHRDLLRFLKPGGALILEGFSKEQLKYDSGGPREESMLFSVEELRTDFEPAILRELDRHLVQVDEGLHHRGDASVVRLIAVKRSGE